MRRKGIKIFLAVVFTSLAALGLYLAFFKGVSTVIQGRIYRSPQPSAECLEKTIRGKGIRTIINLRGMSPEDRWYIDENEIARRHNIRFYSFSLKPHEIPPYLQLMNILDALYWAERPILIHCYRGSDRTGMVSALALAIEQDLPLPELKKQFSARYGVFPFYRSIGPAFFSIYENWLNKSGMTHSRSTLTYWMTHEYQDSYQNIQFWIESINDTDLKTPGVTLPAGTKQVLIKGWAFNARTRLPDNELYITVGNSAPKKADFVHNRPDVARYFDLGDEYYRTFIAGWDVQFSREDLSAGCHEILFRIMDRGVLGRDIPTGRLICLE